MKVPGRETPVVGQIACAICFLAFAVFMTLTLLAHFKNCNIVDCAWMRNGMYLIGKVDLAAIILAAFGFYRDRDKLPSGICLLFGVLFLLIAGYLVTGG
jgi:hypothetical protein